jgi:hypothetical protein
MIGARRSEGETRVSERSPNAEHEMLPPWMRPRPTVDWRRAAAGLAIALALAWGAVQLRPEGALTASVPPLGDAATSHDLLSVAAGFLSGADFATLPASSPVPSLTTVLIIAFGALLLIVPLALIGRWLLGPLWRRYGPRPGPPKLRADGQLPRWIRIALFVLPPPPIPKPGNKPVMARFGFWIAALLHALPPPGPWWLRLVVPVLLGASSIRWWMLFAGAFLGVCINAIGAHLLANAGITPPPPPSGPMLIPLLLAPILITVVIRLLALVLRRLRRPG